jgi:DNA replication protein DnaC
MEDPSTSFRIIPAGSLRMDFNLANGTLRHPTGDMQCAACRSAFVREQGWLSPLCQACKRIEDARHDAEERALATAQREAYFNSRCPALYQASDPALIPDQRAYAEAMAWRYQTQGLTLHGPAGTGKTRTAWALMRRQVMEFNRTISVVSARFISSELAPLLIKEPERFRDRLIQLGRCPLVLLDDIFKAKLTERVEEWIHELLEERCGAKLPTILTLNDTAESLKARISQDRSAPIIRRIVQFTKQIAFELKP